MNNFHFIKHKYSRIFILFLCCFIISCVSHLREAKYHFSKGQNNARVFRKEIAIASYKKACMEAETAVKKNPSAQAYLIKGMAEMKLQRYDKARESFRNAFIFGFEKGEEWAGDLALMGIASTLNEFGLKDASNRIFANLISKSKFKPILLLASRYYMETSLKRTLTETGKNKENSFKSLQVTISKLIQKDVGCGYYHYILSQINGHLNLYQKGFEEAVMAKELGLPTIETNRDNDLQIIFCYKQLEKEMSSEKWNTFKLSYKNWIKRWNWTAPEAPDWKK